jgi:hypothetical protein
LLVAALGLAGCSGAEDTSLIGGGGGKDGGSADTGSQGDSSVMDVQPPKDVQVQDVQPPPDSGPPGKTSLYCGGNVTCTAPTEECCRQGFFQYTYACEMPGQCVGMSIPCDRAQNCASLGMPGTVCCGHYSQQGMQTLVDAVSCKPAGQCTMQQQSVVLCDPNDPNACTGGLKCQLSQVSIPGYYICR